MISLKPLAIIALAISAASGVAATAQGTGSEVKAGDKPPTTDAAKIADALRGGPPFVTERATILDFPANTGGEYRVLRKGTSQWTCMPGGPNGPHDEPGCYDPVYLQFAQDGIAKRPSSIKTAGISYMYEGKFLLPKTSPTLTKAGPEYHVGPHIMIALPHEHQPDLEKVSHDGSDGQPYVNRMAPDQDLYLVIPVRHWPKQ